MKDTILEDYSRFRSFLTRLNYDSLPGLSSQLLMAPEGRRQEISQSGKGKNPTQSSVLLLFYPNAEHVPTMVLIRRSEYTGVHSGQIAFPGGRYEREDADLQQTALREAQEEIGVRPEEITITGKLSELYIPPSNYIVNPFVGYASSRPAFKPDPVEVSALVEVSVPALFDWGNRRISWRNTGQLSIQAPCLSVNGHVIWGATAMILAEFIELTGLK
jgi:8-oxo-dGTP pyrophosphatase MutT (NUDIX family)